MRRLPILALILPALAAVQTPVTGQVAAASGEARTAGELRAVPSGAAADPARAGELRLPNGAIAYVPATALAARSAPLLVLLTGTNGSGRSMLTALRPEADRRGIVLLAPTARGENWDAVDSFFDAYEAGSAEGRTIWPTPRFGIDARRIDDALAAVFARVAVDPGRIGILGYSHGASYALSLGTANPRLFSTIIALSPGILVLPASAAGGQTIYVSHGNRDDVQPFTRTQNSFVPRLSALGFRVTFRPFNGGHVLPRETVAEGIDLFLSAPPR